MFSLENIHAVPRHDFDFAVTDADAVIDLAAHVDHFWVIDHLTIGYDTLSVATGMIQIGIFTSSLSVKWQVGVATIKPIIIPFPRGLYIGGTTKNQTIRIRGVAGVSPSRVAISVVYR